MANMLTVIERLGGGKRWLSNEGVVKRDWVITGRLDLDNNMNGNGDITKLSEFKILVEERRIIESIDGNENMEI